MTRGWLALLLACGAGPAPATAPTEAAPPATAATDSEEAMRHRMVSTQIEARGVHDGAVLAAMRAVPRHRFVPDLYAHAAYEDGPLPIGYDQTISQPYIVAFMTEQLRVSRGSRVLEVGTGSGYQAAVLAQLGAEVWTIEIVPQLGELARTALEATGYVGEQAPQRGPGAVHLRVGDGYRGWPEAEGGPAAFDRIIVTAAPDHVPQPLLDQLAEGGRMIIPVGGRAMQELVVLHKSESGSMSRSSVLPVLFVPMTGEAQQK